MKKADNRLFRPARYQVEVSGQLDKQWSEWFEGAVLRGERERTVLISNVVDQSGLHGLLARIRDLGLPILSIYRLDPGNENVNEMRCCDE